MTVFEKIKERIALAEADVAKAYEGNKSACTRARHVGMDLKNLSNELRVEMLAIQKGKHPAAETSAV